VGGYKVSRTGGHPGGGVFNMLLVLKMHSKPLVGPSSKFDFHQAVFELPLGFIQVSFSRIIGDNSFHLNGLLIQPDF
jgi:hypothetical protein